MNKNIALSSLAFDLKQRQLINKSIKLGLVGCGEMGTDLLCRVAMMQGIEVVHIISRNIEKIFDAIEITYGSKDKAKECNNINQIYNAIELDKIAISTDLDLLLNNDMVEIVIDATGYPNAGAEIAYKSLLNGKHMVMMNVEADVTIGSYLNKLANKQGLIYSLGAGDEPSSCLELINFITAMGHEVIAAGKGKNNPLIFDATPDAYQDEAEKRNMNPRMLVEFIDGSKTMVEMAAIANATGLTIDIPGMHGAEISLEQLDKKLIPKSEGGILTKKHIVDYSISKDIAPGVFAITEIRHPRLRERMKDLKLGDGPYFKFYRPYHLTAMEVPLTCARIALYKKADMTPLDNMTAEVCAVAKKDLHIGDKLDFIGLYTYRAYTINFNEAKQQKAHPCGLLEGAKVIKFIKKGELITKLNCQINENLFIAKLRKLQDRL